MRGYLVIPKLMYIKLFWLKAGRRDFLGIAIQIVSDRSQFRILSLANRKNAEKAPKTTMAALWGAAIVACNNVIKLLRESLERLDALQMRRDIFELVRLLFVPDDLVVLAQQFCAALIV